MRFYKSSSGLKLPSVTSILAATDPNKDKWAKMRSELSAETLAEWEKAKEDGAARGTRIHEQLETLLQPILNSPNQIYLDHLKNSNLKDDPWTKQIYSPLTKLVNRVVYSELYTEHHILGYAGTADLVVIEKDGVFTLYDFKTSKRRKKREWLTEYWLQLAAYTQALRLRKINIQRARLLIMVAGGTRASNFFVEGEELDSYIHQFNTRLSAFKNGTPF